MNFLQLEDKGSFWKKETEKDRNNYIKNLKKMKEKYFWYNFYIKQTFKEGQEISIGLNIHFQWFGFKFNHLIVRFKLIFWEIWWWIW